MMATHLGLLLLPLICTVLSAHEPVRARHGMVVADEPLATDVGVAVLQNGGNAVDAAVAVGFALAVTHPFAGNLGLRGRLRVICIWTRRGILHGSHSTGGVPWAFRGACAGLSWRRRSMEIGDG